MNEITKSIYLKNNMLALIIRLTNQLSVDNIKFANSLIEAGEYGVCLEILSEQLFDVDAKIDRGTYLLIVQLGQQMQLPPKHYEFISTLVKE